MLKTRAFAKPGPVAAWSTVVEAPATDRALAGTTLMSVPGGRGAVEARFGYQRVRIRHGGGIPKWGGCVEAAGGEADYGYWKRGKLGGCRLRIAEN